jgi:DnaK suppressor protein
MSVPTDAALTQAQRDALGALLHQKRDEIQQALSASREDARPVGLDLSIGRLTRVDALQQQHMAAARRRSLELQSAQVQQALGKLASGTYGECARCGEPIGYARLKVRPESPSCIRCQAGAGR